MDVAKALALPLGSLLILSACGYSWNGSSGGGPNKPSEACANSVIPNKYIVQWRDGTRSYVHGADDEAITKYLIHPNRHKIDFVEHSFRVHIHGMASESVGEFSSESPDSWGQERSQANEAWSYAKGEGITVAVIDTGIDTGHVQLRNQLAVNKGEIADNGIDDDGNGLKDDVYGYDFLHGTPIVVDPPKSSHHGSHVSGIILAEHLDGGIGIKGMAPAAKLLPLTFLDEKGNGDIGDGIRAIEYAVKRGARIINASWGGEGCSRSLQRAVAALEQTGVLFVSAAGNGDFWTGIGYNLDDRKSFPAAYGFAWQITVGAMDSLNYRASFSNYSRRLVHLLAPGRDIWSTVYDDGVGKNHGYKLMDGTSMATPFVSGAAALVWSYRPKATGKQVKEALLASVTPGDYEVVTSGYLNVRRALDEIARVVNP